MCLQETSRQNKIGKNDLVRACGAVPQIARALHRLVFGITLVMIAVCAACTVTTGAVFVFAGALVPVAAGLYSSMLLAPALHVRIKAHFDRMKKKHARYEGKKKSAKADAEA